MLPSCDAVSYYGRRVVPKYYDRYPSLAVLQWIIVYKTDAYSRDDVTGRGAPVGRLAELLAYHLQLR